MANVSALKKWAKGNKGDDEDEPKGQPDEPEADEDENEEPEDKGEQEEPEEEEHVDEDLVEKLTDHVDEIEGAIDSFPGDHKLLTSPKGELDEASEAEIEELLNGDLGELRDQLQGITWDDGQDMAERIPDVTEPAIFGGFLFRIGQAA